MKRVCSPPKKQDLSNYYKGFSLVFDLVFPYLFPGFYGSNWKLAFRTFLSLNQTCRALRYFNVLRRWIGWLSHTSVRPMLQLHSFPIPARGDELLDLQDSVVQDLRGLQIATEQNWISHVTSCRLTIPFPSKVTGNFEMDLGEIPFFNMFEAKTANGGYIFTHTPSNFAELALFCFAVMSEPPHDKRAYLAVPLWKHRKDDLIYIEDRSKVNFMNKFLLKKLRSIGQIAPLDVGFTRGPLVETSYSDFCKICDMKQCTATQKLKLFVHGWFCKTLKPRTATENTEQRHQIVIVYQ